MWLSEFAGEKYNEDRLYLQFDYNNQDFHQEIVFTVNNVCVLNVFKTKTVKN